MTSQTTSSPAAHGLGSDMNTTAAIAPSDRRSNIVPPTTTGVPRWLTDSRHPDVGTRARFLETGIQSRRCAGQFQRVLLRWSLRPHRSSALRSSATIAFMASSARGDGTRMDAATRGSPRRRHDRRVDEHAGARRVSRFEEGGARNRIDTLA